MPSTYYDQLCGFVITQFYKPISCGRPESKDVNASSSCSCLLRLGPCSYQASSAVNKYRLSEQVSCSQNAIWRNKFAADMREADLWDILYIDNIDILLISLINYLLLGGIKNIKNCQSRLRRTECCWIKSPVLSNQQSKTDWDYIDCKGK